MKCLATLIIIAIYPTLIGCSSMAHIMHNDNYMAPTGGHWIEGAGADNRTGGFQVYNSNPYALHLEIEETESQGEIELLNGDGGASLNAYAACLTLKVIF